MLIQLLSVLQQNSPFEYSLLLWDWSTQQLMATSTRKPSKKRKRDGRQHKSGATDEKRAQSLIQSVTRVFHWASKAFDIDEGKLLAYIKPLVLLLSGVRH